MLTAPYGVFALLRGLVVDFGGSAELFQALGVYSLSVIVGLLLMIMLVYPLVLNLLLSLSILILKELPLRRC